MEQTQKSRRGFLKASGVVLGMSVLSKAALAQPFLVPDEGTFKISFRHLHTGESFSGVYKVDGHYLPEAFDRINYVLRDFRTRESFPIDPRTIDILQRIHTEVGSREPFEILSGYRSPKTNEMLRRVGNGVAKNSLHMIGQAIDIRMPYYSTQKLRDIARSLHAGGVGYYPRSDFVHVDTGKVRHW